MPDCDCRLAGICGLSHLATFHHLNYIVQLFASLAPNSLSFLLWSGVIPHAFTRWVPTTVHWVGHVSNSLNSSGKMHLPGSFIALLPPFLLFGRSSLHHMFGCTNEWFQNLSECWVVVIKGVDLGIFLGIFCSNLTCFSWGLKQIWFCLVAVYVLSHQALKSL